MTPLERGQILTEEAYLEAVEEHGDEFDARMGAEAVRELLVSLDLNFAITQVREGIAGTKSETKIKRLSKRLKLLEAFIESKNKPEWMVMTVLPVLPPPIPPHKKNNIKHIENNSQNPLKASKKQDFDYLLILFLIFFDIFGGGPWEPEHSPRHLVA